MEHLSILNIKVGSKNVQFRQENLEELMNDFRISLPEDGKISADIVMKSLNTPGMISSSN
jgi:hypothetical protein